MHAMTICRTCKHRPAQEGGCGVPLCSTCRVEADAFMARFAQNDSIESHADSIAVGLISVGFAIILAIVMTALIKGGYGQAWWPL